MHSYKVDGLPEFSKKALANCVRLCHAVSIEGNKVTVRVGAVEHPMLPEHYIEWIALETAQGNQRKPLAPGQKPEAVFMLAEGDSVVAAYEYCNLHSLWKA